MVVWWRESRSNRNGKVVMRRKLKYQKKWNNYTIGDISWINKRRNHPSRKFFVDWVRANNIQSIVEIGAGELIEAKQLSELDYLIVDFSKVFLSEARKQGFKTKRSCMALVRTEKKYDVVYMNSVLEHSPNLEMTFKALRRISKRFFITLFKWSYNGRHGLRPAYCKTGGGYFSTPFDLDKLLELIKVYGDIDGSFVTSSKEKEIIPYKKYRKSLGIIKGEYKHRNGRYLSIYGTWRHTN